MLVVPGPGRSATGSSAKFPVFGTQNDPAITPACAAPSLRFPAATPVCLIVRAVDCPNAPACVCPEQKIPVALVSAVAPVVRASGMLSGVTNVESFGGQSSVVLSVPTGLHASPWLRPALHVFTQSAFVVHDLPVLVEQCPETHVVFTHCGHGAVPLPVRYTRDDSGTFSATSPVVV